nr:MAG TPA: hypothetical protein [Bacteriophage sp.]
MQLYLLVCYHQLHYLHKFLKLHYLLVLIDI